MRLAQEADTAAACEVLRRSITECCVADHRGDDVLMQSWLANKTPDNVHRWLTAGSACFVVAESGNEIVGVAMLLECGEITLCYLTPEARFQGCGKKLLSALEDQARRLGLSNLRLQSTKMARDFYRRNGFEDSGPAESRHGIRSFPMTKALRNP